MSTIDVNNSSTNAYSNASAMSSATTSEAPAATTAPVATTAPAALNSAQSFPAIQQAQDTARLAVMPQPYGDQMLIPKMLESIMSLLNTLMSMLSMMMQKLPSSYIAANAGAAAGASANGTGTSAGAAAGATANGSTASSNASAGANATNTTQPSAGAGALTPSTLNVLRNDAGQIAVSTFDGYVIRTEGKDMAWTITGPDGKTTRIWGDPHVDESDGNKWDFLNRSTFFFGKNKVTVEVAPYGNGQTVTSRITIYSGDERVTIGGIDKNIPTIVAASNDAEQHDLALADGISYTRGADAKGESWTSNQTNAVVGAAA